MPDQPAPETPMTRSDAISQVLGYIQQIDGEWGPRPDGTDDEAIEVLTALGVTHDELVAHSLIKEGYWYNLVCEITGIVCIADADVDVLRRVRKRLAISLDSTDPETRPIRQQLVDLVTPEMWNHTT